MSPEKILYTATATATGGRTGTAKSSDGLLDVQLSTAKELGGPGAPGTNPEQLFAAGYSACFIGAMKAVASGMTGEPKIALPGEVSIRRSVHACGHSTIAGNPSCSIFPSTLVIAVCRWPWRTTIGPACLSTAARACCRFRRSPG